MSVHNVTIGGIPLVYEKEGSGPPLVFIHGGNASAVYWEALIPYFMGEYTCILLEQQGHGRSGRAPDGKYSFAAFTHECAAFLDAVVGPAVLVGQSQGGEVAFGVAARRPELVRGVYSEDAEPLSASVSHMKTLPALEYFRQMAKLALRTESEHLTVAQYAQALANLTPFGRRIADLWLPTQVMFNARFQYHTDPAWYDALMHVEEFAWPDEVATAIPGQIRCPVHIAYGNPSLGGLVLAEALDALRAAGLAFTTTAFPNAGHMISPRFAREFVADLKAFLGRLPA